MILVVFALHQEGSDFMDWLDDQSFNIRKNIQAKIIGVGSEAIRKSLPDLLEKYQPEWLLAAGFAGGLTDEAKIGDLFWATNFSTISLAKSEMKGARFVSVNSVVDSLEARMTLAMHSGAKVVDMESEAIFEIAEIKGVPLLITKIITDTPGAPIPFPFAVSYDLRRQRVRVLATIFWMTAHPFAWLAFYRFMQIVRRARFQLSERVITLLKDSPSRGE